MDEPPFKLLLGMLSTVADRELRIIRSNPVEVSLISSYGLLHCSKISREWCFFTYLLTHSIYLFPMKIKSLVVAGVTAVVLCSTANASFITFTDRAAWSAAVGGTFAEETFSSASTTGFSIEGIGSGHSTGIGNGVYHDRTVLDTTYTNYHFDSLINAFGANWDLTPGGPGQGLQLVIGGQLVTPQIPNTYSGGFFGLVSTTAFNLVSVHSGSFNGSAETHDVDNVVFVSAVPEPESYALMLAGLGLMGGIARRRNAEQV